MADLVLGQVYKDRWGQGGEFLGYTGRVTLAGKRWATFGWGKNTGQYIAEEMVLQSPAQAQAASIPPFTLDRAPVVVPVKGPGVDVREPPPAMPGGGGVVPRMAAPVVSPGPTMRVTPGGSMPTAGQDMRDSPLPGALPPRGMAPAFAGPIAVAGSAVSLRGILGLLPAFMRTRVVQWLSSQGLVRGSRVAWGRLPGWLQQALILIGITVGADLAIDTGPEDIGAIQLPGTTDWPALGGVGSVGPGVSIVGGWTANGVQFYRLSDGRFAVQNSRGRWKIWRVKKPIVLFASGAKDIPTYLRADKALNKQSKAIRATLNRRAPGPKRRPKVIEGQVVTRGGGQIIKID